MVQEWYTEFRCGRASTETTSPGRPIETTTPEMTSEIHDHVPNDPKVKVRKIVEIVSIFMSVWSIFCIHICT